MAYAEGLRQFLAGPMFFYEGRHIIRRPAA